MLFMHETMHYNFFNIGALTLAECNLLVEAFNSREKEKERELKKQKR